MDLRYGKERVEVNLLKYFDWGLVEGKIRRRLREKNDYNSEHTAKNGDEERGTGFRDPGLKNMKLIKFRIRSLEGMADSDWLSAGSGATVLHAESGYSASAVLRTLQHINPACDEFVREEIAGSLKHVKQGEYLRKILPTKRTAALAVFAADIGLVQDLSEVDPDLLETDRIEVGRRLDYSRWLNFVEIASSTRWGQIVNHMQALRQARSAQRLPRDLPPDASCLALTDRIRGDVADALMQWLAETEERVGPECAATISFCRQAVERNERFARARQLVAARLPRFISLQPGDTLKPLYIIDDLVQIAGEGTGNPVAQLLAGLWQKTSPGGSRATRLQLLQQNLEKSSAHLNCLAGGRIMSPRFVVDDSSISITHSELFNDSATDRMVLIAAALLLSQALYGQLPILLLDQFEQDLGQPQQDTLFEYIRNVGEICQVICTVVGAYAADWSGWSGLLHLLEDRQKS